MKRVVLIFGLAILSLLKAGAGYADIITEIGGGIKSPRTTSVLLQEDCHTVNNIEFIPPQGPGDRYYGRGTTSCGGDNPVFVGWPIAWEKDFGVWTVRAGWFHLSHWFDGGQDRELHMDCACASATINWTELRRKRRGNK